jgi:beta-galactosidase
VDADQGFVLNGEMLKLKGGCVHHDNGVMGAASFDRSEERKVEVLKASGYNAVRCAHNPPAPGFLDACDRLGMLVIDEAFDCWRMGKNPYDYHTVFSDWWQRDLDSMVLRDRNHPSVVFWSIGNEIPGQPTPEAAVVGAELAARVRQLDPTRPVAQAVHPGETKDLQVFTNLDVCGYNYMPGNYVPDHQAHPARVICGTESFPKACFDAWMPVVDLPYVIGDFVWTAFDYIGEAGLGHADPILYPVGYVETRPWIAANCGDFDLCGFKLPASYYRDAVWNAGKKVSCFVEALGTNGQPSKVEGWNWGWYDERPSWTWPGWEGKPVRVRVYASVPSVRLTLNGRDLGQKPTDRGTRYLASWDLPYEPGELIATARDNDGKEIDRWVLRSAEKPASVRLTADRTSLAADSQDLSYVTVEVLDSKGTVDPNADCAVRFRISGPGTIVGVGNGDPRSWESFQQPTRKAFRGRCLVVIKASDEAGKITLEAESPGLKPARAVLQTKRSR